MTDITAWFNDPDSPLGFPGPTASLQPLGATTVVAYPTTAGQSEVPSLKWVVLSNDSPYILQVASDRLLGWLMPYTSDKFRLSGASSSGVKVTPQLIGATVGINPTTPGQLPTRGLVYSMWYEVEPVGDYPASFSGTFAPNAQLNQITVATGLTFGPTTLVNEAPYAQTVAIKFIQTSGAATGLKMTATSFFGSDFVGITFYPSGLAGWWYVPVNGAGLILQIDGLTNGVLGGFFGGTLLYAVLPGPIPGPALTAPVFQVGAGGGAVNCPGGGVTTPLIGNPSTGSMIRLTFISAGFTVAPAAGATIEAIGSVSGATYWGAVTTAAQGTLPGSGSCSIHLGGGGVVQDDPAEGLSILNNATQAARVIVAADIVPEPQFGGQYADG